MYALYLAKKSYMPRGIELYHCAWSKGYKIFYSLCEQAGLQPIFWGDENVFSHKYDVVFIDRADGLNIFNSNRDNLKFKKSFYWCETDDHSKGVDLVGFVSTEYMKRSKKKNIFWCGNIANGNKIYSANSNEQLSMIFLGRITKIIAEKIKIIGNNNKDLIIYLMPITVPDKNKERHFDWNNIEEFYNLEKYFSLNNLVILNPQSHKNLNEYVSSISATFGFVPSIYDLNYPNMQLPSSSKFFDYQACGLPCLVEWNVPESCFKEHSIIYKINLDNLDLNLFKLFNKYNILKKSNANHYPDARSKKILKLLI